MKTDQKKNRTPKRTTVRKPKRTREAACGSALAEPSISTNGHATDILLAKDGLVPETITSVRARVDVGFGNALYIRGEGDGLSWEKGTPLECLGASTWVWSTSKASENVVFKLLLNDQVWSEGGDYAVAPGNEIEVVPFFS